MDWQFYTYCQNVSMYKTSLLSWIGSSTLIVRMFLCIKLGSCHELIVQFLQAPVFDSSSIVNVSMYKTSSCHGLAVLHLL